MFKIGDKVKEKEGINSPLSEEIGEIVDIDGEEIVVKFPDLDENYNYLSFELKKVKDIPTKSRKIKTKHEKQLLYADYWKIGKY